MTLDFHEVAEMLGLTAADLKERLADLGLTRLMSEAMRLAHGEAFDTNPASLLRPLLIRKEHIVAAAKDLFQ